MDNKIYEKIKKAAENYHTFCPYEDVIEVFNETVKYLPLISTSAGKDKI